MRRASIGMLILTLLTVALPVVGSATEQPDPWTQTPHALDHVLVKLEPGVQPEHALGQGSTQVLGRWRSHPVAPGRSAEETVDDLVGRPGIETAELDYLIQVDPIPNATPLDHLEPVSVNDPGVDLQWHFPAVQLQEAWAESTGVGVVVAIVDSGVSQAGDDLDCHTFVAPYNAITGAPGLGAASDDYGHGTHVAGTVAQCTDNGVGVAGVSFNASLMPVKVLNGSGNGLTSDVAEGIDWARNHGADVINLSLGGSGTSTVVQEAVGAAVSDGVIVVAASGNGGDDQVLYPAAYPGVIAVGATDYANVRAYYSNGGQELDLVAPGGDTRVDLNNDTYADGVLQETCDIESVVCSGGWGYWFFQGTSMATPHVAGAAALLKSIDPGLDGAAIQSILQATALDLGPTGCDTSYGQGLIQLHDALQSVTGPDSWSPFWPCGAALGAQLIAGGSVELHWPGASDDRTVGGYRIYRDGSVVAQTSSGQNSVTIANLKSLSEYQFSVRAEDPSGNLSPSLSANLATPDFKPPTWPPEADLSVKAYGERQLTVRWSGATDDVGVVKYRVRLTGTTGILTSSTQATVTGLEPGAAYQFEVLARDAAGNWSEPLQGFLRTARAFRDTPGTTFYEDILWMSGEDITRGCNPPVNDLFCPDDPLTRGQMAAFVVRKLGLKANDHPGFLDVDPASTFADDIGKLATAGITRGCNPPVNNRFCPDDPVTRAQMGAFIVRMLGLTANTNPEYADVPAGSTFADDIGKLATAGITRGCNPPVNDRFCPDDPLTRGQLSAFFNRANG